MPVEPGNRLLLTKQPFERNQWVFLVLAEVTNALCLLLLFR
jgi:hypothetical protein